MPEFHREMYADLNFKDKIGVLWIMFRESAKTSLAKIKIIHSVCYNQKKFIIWVSYDQKKAEANLFDIALELQRNDKLIADFGQLFYEPKNKEKSSQKKSIKEFITSNGVKVKAYSTGQSIRGEVYGEYRPDLVIMDDIETNKTVESEAMTDQVINFIDELLSGLGGDANILILANRLVFGGSISYFEDRINDDDKLKEKFTIRDLAVVVDDVIQWPSKYVATDEEAQEYNKNIKDRKQQIVSLETKQRLLGYQVYNREMLNTPITDEEREFKPQWVKKCTREEVERLNTRRFLTIDTAMSEKDSADFTGFCENYICDQNFWHLAGYQLKLNAKDLIDYIFTLHDKRNFEKIGIEKTAYLWGLKVYLEDEQRKRNKFLPIVELEHKQTAKETRIRALIPRYSSFSVYHIEGECRDLDKQLHTFPKCVKDDVLDATAYQEQIVEAPGAYFDNEAVYNNRQKYGYERNC